MFIVAVALIAFGYALFYHGASVTQAYNRVHEFAIDPTSKGGIPLSVLLGIGGKRLRNALPPLLTSVHNPKTGQTIYPPGYRTPTNVTGQGPR